jgi:hypothetical protein
MAVEKGKIHSVEKQGKARKSEEKRGKALVDGHPADRVSNKTHCSAEE